MTRLVRMRFIGLLAAIAVAFAVPASVGAKGQLDIVAKFAAPGLELDVGTYTDPEVEDAKSKLGLLGFASGPVRSSFTMRGDDWAALMALWTRAARMQSRTWRFVGTLTEKGSADASRLTLLAGQGVKFSITSPKGASMTYVMAKADMARFESAIGQVKEFLTK